MLRSEVFAGVLLLLATAAAFTLANTSLHVAYFRARDHLWGPEALGLRLSVGDWASDGLLAVFFFVVGLELKAELVHGRLRDPRAAALPIAAGTGGVVVPGLIFVAINLHRDASVLRGWAVPSATDIAFAVGVFAMLARFLPPAVRVFLLTLAIVDDLLAISIIAIFYTDQLDLLWLGLATVPLAGFAVALRRNPGRWWVALTLALPTWGLVHASGIHATVAGALLGFAVPVLPRPGAGVESKPSADGERSHQGLAAHFLDLWSPVATLFAVPAFAFFSAGVNVGGTTGLRDAVGDSITLGVIAGLVVGKPVGILGATFLLTRIGRLRLQNDLRWPDLIGMALVAGIGFTVSLLVAELAYGDGTADDHVKIGVLLGSLTSTLLGGCVLVVRNRHWRLNARAFDQTATDDGCIGDV
jgi:NhaA family Na+:H+ antiporter